MVLYSFFIYGNISIQFSLCRVFNKSIRSQVSAKILSKRKLRITYPLYLEILWWSPACCKTIFSSFMFLNAQKALLDQWFWHVIINCTPDQKPSWCPTFSHCAGDGRTSYSAIFRVQCKYYSIQCIMYKVQYT